MSAAAEKDVTPWHEYTEDVGDGSMCICGVPALGHAAAFPARDPYSTRVARAKETTDECERDAESDVTHWRRRALFAEEAIRRAMRLYHEAIRDGRTLQPTAVRDALAPRQIMPSSVTPPSEPRT